MTADHGGDNRVLPVLHLTRADVLRAQARLVYEANADGLFLIDMGGSTMPTRDAVELVRSEWPDAWLGVNVLGYGGVSAIRATETWPINGVWIDHLGIDQRPSSWQVMPQLRDALTRRTIFQPDAEFEVFGGVAFKYGPDVSDDDAAKTARMVSCIDGVTVTTSGPGTGQAARPEKLRAMREGIGLERRLAVASGVTPENAAQHFEYVDDVLLATGIEAEWGRFDPHLLDLVLKAR